MAKNYVSSGQKVEYTAGADISSGDVVVVGDSVGIAADDIANGEVGIVELDGVWTVPKTTGAALALGVTVDWDASAGAFAAGITPATGDVIGCAMVAKAALSADETVEVRLTPNTGAAQ